VAAVWVLPRLAWIAGLVAGSAVAAVVLALVVVPRLARRSDRRDAEVYAALPRSDRPGRPIALTATVQPPPGPRPGLSPDHKPAVEAPPMIVNHYGPEFHIYGAEGQDAAAALIRRALTERNQP
jgi:hypothetical protein